MDAAGQILSLLETCALLGGESRHNRGRVSCLTQRVKRQRRRHRGREARDPIAAARQQLTALGRSTPAVMGFTLRSRQPDVPRVKRAYVFCANGKFVRWTAPPKQLQIDLQLLGGAGELEGDQYFVLGNQHTSVDSEAEGVIHKRAVNLEVAFYEVAYNLGSWPTRFLPAYYGTIGSGPEQTLSIEDLTHGFERACVLVLRIGSEAQAAGALALAVPQSAACGYLYSQSRKYMGAMAAYACNGS
eukprot:4624178-Pleurochrysis_carterae.AAC.1